VKLSMDKEPFFILTNLYFDYRNPTLVFVGVAVVWSGKYCQCKFLPELTHLVGKPFGLNFVASDYHFNFIISDELICLFFAEDI